MCLVSDVRMRGRGSYRVAHFPYTILAFFPLTRSLLRLPESFATLMAYMALFWTRGILGFHTKAFPSTKERKEGKIENIPPLLLIHGLSHDSNDGKLTKPK
jgi:hypothetical protein